MIEQPFRHAYSESVREESLDDIELVRLIGLRETLKKENTILIQHGQRIPEAMHDELWDINQRLSERKSRLMEFHTRADGDETYFHMLVAVDDLRLQAEADPQSENVMEKWREAKDTLTAYETEHDKFPVREET